MQNLKVLSFHHGESYKFVQNYRTTLNQSSTLLVCIRNSQDQYYCWIYWDGDG